jgi:hypothetical protein
MILQEAVMVPLDWIILLVVLAFLIALAMGLNRRARR